MRNNLSTGTDKLTRDLTATFPDLKVEAGSMLADKTSKQTSSALSFVNYFLISSGLISLLASIFIISNTFTMLVTQRTKEFVLFRAPDTSRWRLTVSVLSEAFIIDLIGSAASVFAGFGLSQRLFIFPDAMNIIMPGDGLTLESVVVSVPLAVSMIITILATWAPTARAGAVPPMEAARSGDQTTNNGFGAQTWTSAALVSATTAIIAWALQWNNAETKIRTIFVGVGAVMVVASVWFAGSALLMSLTGGLGRVVGAPFGTVGKPTTTNPHRNPCRAGTTSSALTLELVLVTVIGMLGVSMEEAVSEWSETNLTADFVLLPPLTVHLALPPGVEDTVKNIDGVENTAALSSGALLIVPSVEAVTMAESMPEQLENGPGTGGAGISNGNVAKRHGTHAIQESLDLARPETGIVISESTAQKDRWQIDTELVVVAKSGVAQLPVTGISANTADPAQAMIISDTTIHEYFNSRFILPFQTYIDVSNSIVVDGASMDGMKQKLSGAVADYPVV